MAPARRFPPTLAARAAEAGRITLLEGFHAIELAMEDGRVTGLFAALVAGVPAPGWCCSAPGP